MTTTPKTVAAPPRVVLVTGPSGAGLSTAIAALQDAGFEAVDNIPLSLVPALARGAERPMAVGLDGRNREFGAGAVFDLLGALSEDRETELLFLDCDASVLGQRFSETRRRHPLAPGEDAQTGIARDLALMAPLRAAAGALIDTSAMTVHDLRGELARLYGRGAGTAVTVTSFSYRRGLPPGVDLVLDCRALPNPHWVPELRALDGRDPAVAAHALDGPVGAAFAGHVDGLVRLLLPAPGQGPQRAHLGIGFGCTGGQHRSVAMTERLAAALAAEGWQVSKRHRELHRHALEEARTGRPVDAGRGA